MTRTTHYTRWRRDHGGKLVLRQESYRVIGRPHVVERGLAMRDAAMVTGAAAIWFFAVLCIALSTQGCASADGSPPPPEEPSPEAQPDLLPVDVEAPLGRNWCCAAERFGVPVLACGYSTKPSYAQLCYCAGIVSGDECDDNTAWTPGTLCTQADVVCFEGE